MLIAALSKKSCQVPGPARQGGGKLHCAMLFNDIARALRHDDVGQYGHFARSVVVMEEMFAMVLFSSGTNALYML